MNTMGETRMPVVTVNAHRSNCFAAKTFWMMMAAPYTEKKMFSMFALLFAFIWLPTFRVHVVLVLDPLRKVVESEVFEVHPLVALWDFATDNLGAVEYL